MSDQTRLSPFCIAQRVYYQHTDVGGVVYHGRYLDFMESARIEFLRSLGFDLAELAARDAVMFIVRGARLEFARPARLGDLLTITAEVAKVGFASLDFVQRVLAQRSSRGEELLVTGRLELGCVHPQTLKPVRMPQTVRTTLGTPA
jgi:acyl-CoA thioester hydrolase